MYKLYPYFTNDGSVGLFSPTDNDIYHSTYGALTEAYEKFVLPADIETYLLNKSEIKVLDICYGIGYNSKSFINYIFNLKNFSKNSSHGDMYIDTIDKDNIFKDYCIEKIDNDKISECNNGICVDKIHNDNAFQEVLHESHKKNDFKIYIKAIDTDIILAFLSPFIICDKKNLPEDYKLPFNNEKISKMLHKSPKSKIKFSKEINVIFLLKILENHPEIYENKDLASILTSKEYHQFFEPFILHLFELYRLERGINTPKSRVTAFLHNIYYNYLSKRYKPALKSPIFNKFIFDLKINDARKEIITDANKYDLIFLDAFTPAKCPMLWSVDFFKLLYEHLDDNGRILTYSNSATIRNAFINAGFYIGKIYNNTSDKFMGTIATKNKSLIKNDLSEYDLGLLKTKAGVFYRDKNLNGLNDEILATHKREVEISDLESSSHYIKRMKKGK